MRQNCPSFTDKATQTLTFDVQFPHERCCKFGELPQFCLFKIAHRQVRLAQVDGETAGMRLWRYVFTWATDPVLGRILTGKDGAAVSK
jgi:hypothetical protein